MSIGENIKRIRKNKGLTQEQLAKLSDLSKNAIYNYENNKRIPTIDILEEIANALGVTVQELITGQKQYIKVIEKDITDFSTEELIRELYRRIEKD